MKDILIYTYQWFLTVIYNKGYDYNKASLNNKISIERAQEVAFFTLRNILGILIFILLVILYSLITGPCLFNTRTFLRGNLTALIIVFLLIMIYGYISKIHIKPIFKGILPKEVTENELKKMNIKYIAILVIMPILVVGSLIGIGYIVGQLEKILC